ncbi:GPP34 family phosphoprotein [Lentzea sp. BCCO 10_0856]|uniref:GPP34 family phosphoprotein n=1 Tax=Lentzea miocenica TaxID=3095431 RepID=A0ABU4T2D7_9PSEU|nr:GPP34 family phosphoprotein [Lentzea sp. BCCO 10_0856]MDX8032325.1 GPP34 family phosphoprotein [Lentzea sp. BCCO 10_0856]
MLPEDLLLLFVDERTGQALAGPEAVENALSGAMLIELVHSGRLAYDPNGLQLWVPDPTPLPHPLLHESLVRLRAPLTPRRAVPRIRRHVRDNVMAGLEARGVLAVEKRIFGGFVIRDPAVAGEVRTAVGSTLFGHRAPDARSGALISLLHAVKSVHKVFSGGKHELTARAKQLADGCAPAVAAIHAAVAAEMVVATVAATSEGRLLR